MQGRENVLRAPKKSLGGLDAEIAALLIGASADITLIIDARGIIRDVASSNQFSDKDCKHWLGRPWIETVTGESRNAIEGLSRDANTCSSLRWLHVTHQWKNGVGIPVRYAAIQIGKTGRFVAVGRDLSGDLALQQRAADAQQLLEEEALRLRDAEGLFRLLFRATSQPVLVLGSNLRVVSANPAACSLLNKDLKRFTGRTFTDIFDAEGAKAIQAWLSKALALGRGDEIRATLAEAEQEITVFASIFRQDGDSYYLVRLSPVVEDRRSSGAWSSLVGIVEDLPMGFVVTDLNQRILIANPAFLDFVELVSLEQVRGERLDKWLGRPGIDLDAIVTTLRNRGAVQNFTTIMRGDHGSLAEVEITAVKTADSFGFSVRRMPKHVRNESRGSRELLRSVDELTKLVGRVTLKELVRESTDAIEKLCIETALDLTNENRAFAADLLGLSRQSLYSKLRRFGLETKREAANLSAGREKAFRRGHQ